MVFVPMTAEKATEIGLALQRTSIVAHHRDENICPKVFFKSFLFCRDPRFCRAPPQMQRSLPPGISTSRDRSKLNDSRGGSWPKKAEDQFGLRGPADEPLADDWWKIYAQERESLDWEASEPKT